MSHLSKIELPYIFPRRRGIHPCDFKHFQGVRFSRFLSAIGKNSFVLLNLCIFLCLEQLSTLTFFLEITDKIERGKNRERKKKKKIRGNRRTERAPLLPCAIVFNFLVTICFPWLLIFIFFYSFPRILILLRYNKDRTLYRSPCY